MTNFTAGIAGIAGFVLFLGLMVWWVPAPPLIVIVIGVTILLIYDWMSTLIYGESGEPPQGVFPMILGAYVFASGLTAAWLSYEPARAAGGFRYAVLTVAMTVAISAGLAMFFFGLRTFARRVRPAGNRRE
jgi:hypothetical protein